MPLTSSGRTYARAEVATQRQDARNGAFDEAAMMLDRQAFYAEPAVAALVRQLAEAVRQMKATPST